MKSRNLPLFTGQAMTIAELKAQQAAEMSEREIQRTLVAELRNPLLTDGPTLVFAVPNGFWVPKPASVTRQIWNRVLGIVWNTLIADGARKGASDLVVAWNGRVLFLEVKVSDGGRLSKDQGDFRDECLAAGMRYEVARGLEGGRKILRDFGAVK